MIITATALYLYITGEGLAQSWIIVAFVADLLIAEEIGAE